MGPLTRWDVFSWLLVASALQVSSVRATYLCTAYLNISYVVPETNQTSWHQEEMGLYGQDSPKTSVAGNVYLAEPIDGCEWDTVYRRPNGSRGWIALIQRGNGCTFSDKINVAAMNGAAAAVIINEYGTFRIIQNRVIQMSHPGTSIVAVMIGYIHGLDLVRLLKQGVPVAIAIEVGNQHGPWMNNYSVFFVSISFFIVTAAMVGYFIFYYARRLNGLRQQNRKQEKLKAEAKKAIGQLQIRTLRQGDQETGPDADTCAVCIELYKPGDVLSILTCNHYFHNSCIEPWLLEHRTCPMCKCDILKALGVEDIHSETATHTHSETTSSGYASMHGHEQLGLAEDAQNGLRDEQLEVPPQYDNLAFESDIHSQSEVRT
ncbi:E3 ubiquitin-protein ligase RNF128-like [Xyrauchen texanus]|uniref:E3 ubiquitin-protein ligase RNF128-like n=1 Tax=Xyrauchen texanus TaxID=154827 RepID=UPI0022423578|nr:E3 ubiquitin-protein ligase RNF128-like [Xyrauchen texanus]